MLAISTNIRSDFFPSGWWKFDLVVIATVALMGIAGIMLCLNSTSRQWIARSFNVSDDYKGVARPAGLIVVIPVIAISGWLFYAYYRTPSTYSLLSNGVPSVFVLTVFLVVSITFMRRALLRAEDEEDKERWTIPPVVTTATFFGFVSYMLAAFSSADYQFFSKHPMQFMPHSFTRPDMVYFVISNFTTVGAYQMGPTSSDGRMLVTTQILLGSAALSVGIGVLISVITVRIRGRRG
jgi:hypothetical protein